MDFVNFETAKQRLGKSDDELQGMIKKGEIRAFRDGQDWKFRKEDIDAMAGPDEGEPSEDEAGDTLMSIDADILFAEEEDVPADSAAETWIAADTEGVFPGEGPGEAPRDVQEAMAAPATEPAPLALSPETDESSLQEVLSEDELGGAEEDVFGDEPAVAVDSGSAMVPATAGVAPSRTRIVTLVEPQAHHGSFTVLMVLGLLGVILTGLVFLAYLTGNRPTFFRNLGEGNGPLILLGAGVFIILVVTLIGFVLESQRQRREALGG